MLLDRITNCYLSYLISFRDHVNHSKDIPHDLGKPNDKLHWDATSGNGWSTFQAFTSLQ